MINAISSVEDIASLKEGTEVECKKAAGKYEQGEVPKDVWKTFSAMANTRGGDIFLGISEKPIGVFKVTGIAVRGSFPNTRSPISSGIWLR